MGQRRDTDGTDMDTGVGATGHQPQGTSPSTPSLSSRDTGHRPRASGEGADRDLVAAVIDVLDRKYEMLHLTHSQVDKNAFVRQVTETIFAWAKEGHPPCFKWQHEQPDYADVARAMRAICTR